MWFVVPHTALRWCKLHVHAHLDVPNEFRAFKVGMGGQILSIPEQ